MYIVSNVTACKIDRNIFKYEIQSVVCVFDLFLVSSVSVVTLLKRRSSNPPIYSILFINIPLSLIYFNNKHIITAIIYSNTQNKKKTFCNHNVKKKTFGAISYYIYIYSSNFTNNNLFALLLCVFVHNVSIILNYDKHYEMYDFLPFVTSFC